MILPFTGNFSSSITNKDAKLTLLTKGSRQSDKAPLILRDSLPIIIITIIIIKKDKCISSEYVEQAAHQLELDHFRLPRRRHSSSSMTVAILYFRSTRFVKKS